MTKESVDALRQLIADKIATAPYELDGFMWCAMPQSDICAKLTISVSTLCRMISKPPIIRERAQGFTLLREGIPGPKTKRQVQRHLANIWRKITGIPIIGGKPFGHLAGMVDAWGLDKAPAVLTLVLMNWSKFMAGVHIEIEMLGDDGYKRFYEYPSTSVILRFNKVGIEMYLSDQQENYGLNADCGGLWFS
ncbi:hypothetical protein MESS2_1030152 [Mesorhizobium metallidurans STM 2683]|uniref:Uncharacterized protein n=1 Tax=Mesorhizobium metallidurans STM 2683 TaxID=1297569 RepID=M5EGC1_9HYPH|nr:hypothetical protein [Mesorhizobium metallidurans]CCV03295.1 hypothetical protein MESS2_1030152 [Mesorhizobium metallidurans STM 2683]